MLAQLLTLGRRGNMSLQWFREQEYAIEKLPSSLRRSDGFLSRLRMAVPSSKKAVLCSSHKGLNPFLIHRLFIRLTAECTTCQYRLSQNPHLPPNLAKLLDRIHAINRLWVSPKVYTEIFKVSSSQPCYEMIPGGCEACILATVGSNDEMLSDLRAAMYGRKKKDRPFPRLFSFVDSWIKGTVFGDLIREESEVLGTEIRACRKQMRMARRQFERNIEEGIINRELAGEKIGIVEREFPDEKDPLLGELYEEDEKEHDENAEDALEDSILNYYHTAGVQSTSNLDSHTKSPTILPEEVHPSFRDSFMTFDDATGTFACRNGTNPMASTTLLSSFGSTSPKGPRETIEPSNFFPPQRPRTAYSESVYSCSQSGRPSDHPSSTPDVPRIPSRYGQPAKSRAMMGVEEEDEDHRRSAKHGHRRAQKSSATSKRETKWSDFR